MPIPGGGFVCTRGARFRTRFLCDVCDVPVTRPDSEQRWNGVTIDLCPRCKTRYPEVEFREWADHMIAKHYPEAGG